MKTVKYSGIRKPRVAGTFYPATREGIEGFVLSSLEREQKQIDAQDPAGSIIGGVVPHAGMEYCGRQAVHFFEILRRSEQYFDTVVIVHPNHHGQGPPASVDGHACWESPLGQTEVDVDLSDTLDLPVSKSAQLEEHSAEVLLPWLQYFLVPGFKIVPVNMRKQDPGNAGQVARSVHLAGKKLDRRILFLASSDFSHFLSPGEAERRDGKVLDGIFRRDARAVNEAVHTNRVSVCGYGPIMSLLEYASMVDPDYRVRLLRKGHSGEVSPSIAVVSYVSLVMESR